MNIFCNVDCLKRTPPLCLSKIILAFAFSKGAVLLSKWDLFVILYPSANRQKLQYFARICRKLAKIALLDTGAEYVRMLWQKKVGGFMMVTGLTLEGIYPFFAIVCRENVRILLKEITPDTLPIPNHTRHEWARWEAFILVSDPDALFAEYQSRGLEFHEPPRRHRRRSPRL